MEYRIIKSPSAGTREILLRRRSAPATAPWPACDAIGLVQGRLIDMVVAADIAEKAAGVVVEDIRGQCPQNLVMIAIFGDTAAVEAAMADIQTKFKQDRTGGNI